MTPSFAPLYPKIVLAIGAHPDDMDFGAGGSLAAFARQGAAIHYLQVTDGCKGSSDASIDCEQLRQIREQEQQAACERLGGQSVTFLRFRDGELEITNDLKKAIVAEIRRLQPDVVITMDPGELYAPSYGMVNHSDHRVTGLAAMDAVYPLARDHLNYPDMLEAGLQPHNVKTLLFTNFEHHNYFVDISETLPTKLEAVAAHTSQIADIEQINAMFTDIASTLGKQAGYQYAEGFRRIDIAI